MRKSLLLALLVTGCSPAPKEAQEERTIADITIIGGVESCGNQLSGPNMYASEMHHEGHDYIILERYNGGAAIIHSESCACKHSIEVVP